MCKDQDPRISNYIRSLKTEENVGRICDTIRKIIQVQRELNRSLSDEDIELLGDSMRGAVIAEVKDRNPVATATAHLIAAQMHLANHIPFSAALDAWMNEQ